MAFAEILKTIRRRPNTGNTSNVAASGATFPIRLGGTSPATDVNYERDPKDAALGNDNPNGRTGNDWLYPDMPRGRFDVGTVNGQRRQAQTWRHLHEGEAPGRIPRGWNSRVSGKVGGSSGNPAGTQSPEITMTGTQGGGLGEMMYIPHTPTPRGVGIARTYLRTVDDAANIPGVFLSDPTRR